MSVSTSIFQTKSFFLFLVVFGNNNEQEEKNHFHRVNQQRTD